MPPGKLHPAIGQSARGQAQASYGWLPALPPGTGPAQNGEHAGRRDSTTRMHTHSLARAPSAPAPPRPASAAQRPAGAAGRAATTLPAPPPDRTARAAGKWRSAEGADGATGSAVALEGVWNARHCQTLAAVARLAAFARTASDPGAGDRNGSWLGRLARAGGSQPTAALAAVPAASPAHLDGDGLVDAQAVAQRAEQAQRGAVVGPDAAPIDDASTQPLALQRRPQPSVRGPIGGLS